VNASRTEPSGIAEAFVSLGFSPVQGIWFTLAFAKPITMAAGTWLDSPIDCPGRFTGVIYRGQMRAGMLVAGFYGANVGVSPKFRYRRVDGASERDISLRLDGDLSPDLFHRIYARTSYESANVLRVLCWNRYEPADFCRAAEHRQF
jgi:hypothetical protein